MTTVLGWLVSSEKRGWRSGEVIERRRNVREAKRIKLGNLRNISLNFECGWLGKVLTASNMMRVEDVTVETVSR